MVQEISKLGDAMCFLRVRTVIVIIVIKSIRYLSSYVADYRKKSLAKAYTSGDCKVTNEFLIVKKICAKLGFVSEVFNHSSGYSPNPTIK